MTPDTSNPDIVRIFDRLARSRRSIRGFLNQPVEQDILEQIFETAAFSPSNCNTQPWYSYVVSGEMRDKLSRIFMETIGQGHYSLDFPYDAKYEGIYRQRQLDVGLLLYKALGVTREDREGKRQAFLRNLEFFDAPHVVFIFLPEWGGIREACDVGMYAQNLMLGDARARYCQLSADHPWLRRRLGSPGTRYRCRNEASVWNFFWIRGQGLPENRIVPDRASLDESVHFYD